MKCPKCGYVRRDDDRAPSYECPSCGIVYAKYIAKLGGEREEKSSSMPAQSQRRLVAGVSAGHIFRNVLNYFKSRCGRFFLASFAFVVIIFLAASLLVFTEYGRLRWQYWSYVESFEDLKFDAAYQHLSPATRRQVSSSAWRLFWEKNSDLRVTEKFGDVEFSSDKRKARVQSTTIVEGVATGLNYQSWVKYGDAWYRDFAQDDPQRVAGINRVYAKILNQTSRPFLAQLRTSWAVRSDSIGRINVNPRTNLVIRNDGSDPITELYVKVDYFDNVTRLVIDSVERVVVAGGDSPLLPGDNSQLVVLDTTAGFSAPFDSVDAGFAEKMNGRMERHIYFRRDLSQEWETMSVSHLVGN